MIYEGLAPGFLIAKSIFMKLLRVAGSSGRGGPARSAHPVRNFSPAWLRTCFDLLRASHSIASEQCGHNLPIIPNTHGQRTVTLISDQSIPFCVYRGFKNAY